MAKKATSFMKASGKGFIKVWKSRKKTGATIRQAWTEGRILVLDGLPYEFDLPCGSYVYEPKGGLIKPGKVPDIKSVIPKQKGYHKVEVVTEYNLLSLLKWDSFFLVTLKGNGVKAFLRYDFYQYLTENAYSTDITWKVKSKRDPVLFFLDKCLCAMVMPYNLNE